MIKRSLTAVEAARRARTANASAARRTIGLTGAADKLRGGGAEGAALAADVARDAGYVVVTPADVPSSAATALDAAIDATGRMHGDPQPSGSELLAELARLGYIVTPANTTEKLAAKCACRRHVRVLWSGPIGTTDSRPVVAVCGHDPARCGHRQAIPESAVTSLHQPGTAAR